MKRTLALLLVVACGGGNDTESTEPVTPANTGGETEVVATSNVMPLAPFALVFPDGRVSMDAEGNVSVEGQSNTPTMYADGRVMVDGAVVAELNAEGVLLASGEQIATVDESGSATVAGNQISFDESGLLTGAPTGVEIRLEPADTPARRAAMVAFILVLTPGEDVSTEPVTEAPQP